MRFNVEKWTNKRTEKGSSPEYRARIKHLLIISWALAKHSTVPSNQIDYTVMTMAHDKKSWCRFFFQRVVSFSSHTKWRTQFRLDEKVETLGKLVLFARRFIAVWQWQRKRFTFSNKFGLASKIWIFYIIRSKFHSIENFLITYFD